MSIYMQTFRITRRQHESENAAASSFRVTFTMKTSQTAPGMALAPRPDIDHHSQRRMVKAAQKARHTAWVKQSERAAKAQHQLETEQAKIALCMLLVEAHHYQKNHALSHPQGPRARASSCPIGLKMRGQGLIQKPGFNITSVPVLEVVLRDLCSVLCIEDDQSVCRRVEYMMEQLQQLRLFQI